MIRCFITLVVFFFSFFSSFAQDNSLSKDAIKSLEVAVSQIDDYAKTFCVYISNIEKPIYMCSVEEKNEIMNKMPNLFYNYKTVPHGPRKMVLLSDKDTIKEHFIYQYLNNLVRVSSNPSYTVRNKKCEYTYDKIISHSNLYDPNKWTLEDSFGDGCSLYSNSIQLTYKYYEISYFDNGETNLKIIEEGIADVKVYLIYNKSDSTFFARLGDVYRHRAL